ncbi:hypothetical protein AMK32_08560 [Streptomyces sp. CB01883]|nr:hypothetical protein AMK32_08560 [Streptomyces sp. CB01883]
MLTYGMTDPCTGRQIMVKEPAGVKYCARCHRPVSLGADTARGESAEPRHITVPGQPTECPE